LSNILITGATGFIGRALSSKLKVQGYDTILIGSADGDIACKDTVNKLADSDITHVFHLAGKTYVPDSWAHPDEFYRTNVLGTTNILEFCKSLRISMTFVSSYVYGHPETLPIKESSRIRPSNPYALSKRLAEEACEFYAHTHELAITAIRPFNIYGIGQDNRFIIPSIIRQVLVEKEIKVHDLIPKRDYVYLEDLVSALLATLRQPKGYNVYNVGSGVSISVKEVIDIIQEVANTNKRIISDCDVRPNELMDVVADISKAQIDLGWRPHYSFKEGIVNMLDY
jgi:nucleoside-diphosphate-sugar epimerase